MELKSWIINKRISILLLVLFSINGMAQDMEFDQYQNAPTYLNPALTGVINGNYRINAIYHNQWSGQLDAGVNAFFAGGDVKFENQNNKNGIDFWGLGLSFLNDEYNEFNLSTRTLSVTSSYHKQLDDRYKQFVGLGVQLGINQKNIDYEALTFEDQFDQLGGYNNSTGELLPQNNYGYIDFGTGVFYSIKPNKSLFFNLGVSYTHANQPNISFYQVVQNPVSSLEQENLLHSKINVHTSASIGIGEKLFVIPDFLFQKQGGYQSILVGTRLKLDLNYEDPNNSVIVGFRVKLSDNIDGSSLSAAMFNTDYKYKNMSLGFSYNVLLEPAISNQLMFNTFEFSMKYTGIYSNDQYHCPEF